MVYAFKLPDVGEGVAEVEIGAWRVAPGDEVREDQPLLEVISDKATVEITSPVAGRVLEIAGEVGGSVAVGSVVAVFETSVEPGSAPEPEPTSSSSTAIPPGAPVAPPGGRSLAAPAVRRRAQTLGLDLGQVTGSGPGGRISHADLDAHRASSARRGGLERRDGVEVVKLTGLRRRIADRMSVAHQRVASFSYIEEIDVTELEALRTRLNAAYEGGGPRLTLLPFLIRALTRTLPDYPNINAVFDDEAGELRQYAPVHVGVAVQAPGGLVVPVLRHAEALDLWGAAEGIARLAAAARAGKLGQDDLSGSTITLTSLGRLGGLAATPVVNYPEVAIIGPNRIIERPVVVGGTVTVRKMMNLSSSFDHRIIDGQVAAEFIQRLKSLLEVPAMLFIDGPRMVAKSTQPIGGAAGT